MKKAVLKTMFILIVTFMLTLMLMPSKEGIYRTEDYIKNGKYHFIFIAKESDYFWEDIEKGILEEAEENEVTVSILKSDYFDKNKILSYMDRAIESSPNGIMAYGLDEEDFEILIKRAKSQNIPWITVYQDTKKSDRDCYIGINNYYTGLLMARETIKAVKKGEVAVIMNSEESSYILTAIMDEINKKEEVEVIETAYIDMNRVNTYKVVEDIINEKRNLKGIICTDPYATYAAGQAVVRLNKVGQIKIVGMGGLEETNRFVDKKVIHGIFLSNPKEIGRTALKTMMDIKEDRFVNDAIFVDVKYITKEND